MTITDLTQVRASAVPAVPKEITATQRLTALNSAQNLEDMAEYVTGVDVAPAFRAAMLGAAQLLRELAR